MKTQAVVFTKADTYEVRELTLPEPGPGDVSVRTLVSAISPGTERWVMRGKHLGTRFPCVPGYHRIGVVEACGRDVKDLEVGDVVYGSAGSWEETDIISMWGAHVGYSVSGPAGYRFISATMPNSFELDTLSFAMVVGTANRGINALEVMAPERVLIIGAGIIGICAAQLCGLRGAQAVLLEKDAERNAFVRELGLSALCIDDPALDDQLDQAAPAGFDVLYDTAGHAATTDRMVRRVCQRGRLLLQSQYFDKEKCAIDLDQIKVSEITVKTTCGIDARDFLETTTNIRTRRLKIGPLITHRFQAPDDLLKGYELLDKSAEFNLGMVFNWS